MLNKKSQDLTVGETMLLGAVLASIGFLPMIVAWIAEWWSNR